MFRFGIEYSACFIPFIPHKYPEICAVIPTLQRRKLRPRKMKLFAQIQIRMLQ